MWTGDSCDFRRDHGNFQTGAPDSVDGFGKIGFRSFRQNMAIGTNREVNAVEANIPGNRGCLADAGPVKMLREHTNLQLVRDVWLCLYLVGAAGEGVQASRGSRSQQQAAT